MIRLLVIGAGEMGARHARHVLGRPGLALAGIVDPAPQRVADLDVPTWPELGAVTGRVDGAIVATPNATHAALGRACLERGWPVLVEKPIAATLAEAEALVAAAEAAGLPLLVGHHRRQYAAAQAARDLLAAGAIGRPAGVSVVWSLRKHDGYFAEPWRVAAGGGPILLNLVHEIDLLRFVLGEIAEAACLASAALRGGPVEDGAALALRFAGGALGSVLLSDAGLSPWAWEAATGENPSVPRSGEDCWRITGTLGALSFPSLTLWRHEGEGPADWRRPLSAIPLPAPPTDPFPAQIDHFAAVIRGEAIPLAPGRDGIGTLRATLAVAEAARTGRAVRTGA